jgi:hypothetical protein
MFLCMFRSYTLTIFRWNIHAKIKTELCMTRSVLKKLAVKMKKIVSVTSWLTHAIYAEITAPKDHLSVKSRRMRWAGHVARVGKERKVYKVLVGKPDGRRPLGRPRRRWEDGIRMDLRETGLGCVDWIRLAQDMDRWRAVVSAVMNLRVLTPRS